MGKKSLILNSSGRNQIVGALALVSLIGCGDPTQGTVSGVVSVDGEAAASGSISFFPVDGKGRVTGGTIEQGAYEVQAPVGTVRVEIRVPRAVGERKVYDTPDSPVKTLFDESLPARYNDESELTYLVEPGSAVKNFELTTGPVGSGG